MKGYNLKDKFRFLILVGILITINAYANEDYYKALGANDKVKELYYFTKACDEGHGYSCFSLGHIYSKEISFVKQNKLKALKYYDKACEMNVFQSCSTVGYAYQYGEVLEKDMKKALQYYQKACDGGDDRGCKNKDRLNYKGSTK